MSTTQLNVGAVLSEQPAELKIELFEYQRAEIAALMQNERTRFKILKDSGATREIVECHASYLSSPFGSGKTFIVLGYLSLCKPQCKYQPVTFAACTKDEFQNDVVQKFGTVLNVDLIIVGAPVFIQWRENIRRFTNFRLFEISGMHKLREFNRLVKEGLLESSYDIVLVKNGSVEDYFGKNGKTTNTVVPIVNSISTILGNTACKNVVYDDFDTIHLPHGARAINGLYTIYVSASRNKNTAVAADVQFKSIGELYAKLSHPIITSVNNDVNLDSVFSVCSSQAYIRRSVELPLINVVKCVYANPDNKYVELFKFMGGDNALAAAEGLNADAVDTVAQMVGIKVKPTAASIFEKLLADDHAKYELACFTLDAIEKFIAVYTGLIKARELTVHQYINHNSHELNAIESWILKRGKVWKFLKDEIEAKVRGETVEYIDDDAATEKPGVKKRDILLADHERSVDPTVAKRVLGDAHSANCDEMLGGMHDKFTENKVVNGRSIDNVKRKLREGDCAICCLPLETDISIAKCCAAVICGQCTLASFRFKKVRDYKTSKETVRGSCPNCSREVDIAKDLIYVSGVDINKVADSTGIEVEDAEPIVEEVEKTTPPDDYGTTNPKMRALYDIIRGVTPDNSKPSTLNVPGVLPGLVDVPVPAKEHRRILLFAGYNETLTKVMSYLDEKKITTLTLGGNIEEIHATVDKFRVYDGTIVLLINSNQVCAGLDLQFCTDICFFHKLMNPAIESQVAGRAQRVGRKFNLNMWYLCYDNESVEA